MTTIPLTKPVKAHGKEITEISLREPNGEDIIACGYPLQMGDGTATPQAAAVAKYIARLGDVPPSTVRQVTAEDFNNLMAGVLGFFGGSAATDTTGPTS